MTSRSGINRSSRAPDIEIEEFVSPEETVNIEDRKPQCPTPGDAYNRDLPQGATLEGIELRELNADEQLTYEILENSFYCKLPAWDSIWSTYESFAYELECSIAQKYRVKEVETPPRASY